MLDANELTKSVNNDKSAVVSFDKQRFSDLTRLVMGNRTMVQFSHDTGLNRGLIGTIINKKLDNPPSQRSIYRMMSSAAMPQNNVSLNDMLAAAGYVPSSGEGVSTVIPLQLSDLVLASYVSSPSKPLTLFLDLLIRSGIEQNVDIRFRGGWFEVTGTDTGNRYVGINAFRREDVDQEFAKVFLKANLLDTLSTAESVKGISDKAYYILTNDQAVYDFALTLPQLGARSMSVLLSDSELTQFVEGAAVGGENDTGSRSVDKILLKLTTRI